MEPGEQGPLSGLRVVEYAQGIPGPYCGKLLADLGANVVKVEPPNGDRSRSWGPFPNGQQGPERSGMFLYLNTSKRGIAFSLPAGIDAFHALLENADILIHGLTPATAAATGLDYDAIHARHPHLIVTAVTPFGLTGPDANAPATELTVYHRSGMAFDTPQGGIEDLALPPLRPGGWQAHFLSGMVAATATMMAVTAQESGAGGQLVDVSELEALTGVMTRINLHQLTYEGKRGSRLRATDRALSYLPCKDGYVNISLVQPHWWANLVHAMGDPDWAMDPLFQDPNFRGGAWDALQPLIEDWAKDYTRQELFEMLQAAHVPCLPGNTFADVVADPHLRERGFFVDVDSLRMPGAPYLFSQTPWRIHSRAPRLGEHNTIATVVRRNPWPDLSLRGAGGGGGTPGERRGNLGWGSRPDSGNHTRQSGLAASKLPLHGLRVVDFTWVFGGPTCCLFLAAMGAEVIKVESLLRPDTTRQQRAYREGQPEQPTGGGFDNLNYSKKDITLNLKMPEAQELARKVIAKSDIVVENYAAGVMDRLGLGYQELRRVQPDIIMLSMSLFGATGPYRKYFGYGGPLPVFTGLASITGYPGTPPRTVGASWPDPLNGVSATFAILAALRHRRHTGEGQYIDLSMTEGAIATLPWGMLAYEMNGRVLGPEVNRDPFMAPHGAYPCHGEDAWLAIAVETEDQWAALCRMAGHSEWLADPRFSSLHARKVHEDALDALVSDWTAPQDKFQAASQLQNAGIPAAPSQDRAGLLEDPHLTARGAFPQILDAAGQTTHPIPGMPWRLSNAAPRYEKPPRLGEHNDDVFTELLGLTADEVQAYQDAQVIY